MYEKVTNILIEVGIVAAIVIGGWITISIVLRALKKGLEKSRLDGALHLFILKTTKITLWIVLIIAVLPRLGVGAGSLITVLGAGGAAIALALKDSLGNIAGGIIILVNKPFGRGDTIEVNGMIGVVDSIDLLTTNLHTADNKVMTVPNGIITTSVISNYSRENKRRVDCTFGISYDADIAAAKEILANIAADNADIMEEPQPVIGVASHGDNAVLIDLKVWCSTDKYFDVKYFIEENVKIAFDEAEIGIPYPQMDVHIVK